MTPRFLRDEANRFRGMAETADRPSSRTRLLAMASDYEARAQAAEGLSGDVPEETPVVTEAEPAPPRPAAAPAPAARVRLARRPAKGSEPAPDDGRA